MSEITNDGIASENNGIISETSETTAANECSADIAATADIGLTENAENENANSAVNSESQTERTQKKNRRPLPPKIQKVVDYLNAHEDIRQMVFFLMFSVLCGLSQLIVTYALSAGLKLASSLNANFDWFVFHFTTSAEFIGFLVGSIVGQVLTFVLNRKKTFNMPDYLALRAVMYAILAIIIIIMQTYLGGVVTSACYGAVPKEEASEFLQLVFNLTGQAVAGIAAVIINFLGNKFLVMRDWGKKKKSAQDSEAPSVNADSDIQAQVCCDIDEKTEA